MNPTKSIVQVEETRHPRAEELPGDAAPTIGQWYWVLGEPESEHEGQRRLACVTRVGSNYVKMAYVEDESSERVHEDEFHTRAEFVPDADAILRGNAERCRRELDGLMEDVKLLTSKLGVSTSAMLGAGGEATATSLVLAQGAPASEYKTALVKAKEETLPALFKAIKDKSEEYSTWLSAQVIPMRAEAKKLEPAIKSVEDRIFSVELYAGLCEEVEQIKDGEPAGLTEPVHLFQRRLYMDEECLANYDAGGMEFKQLRQFERWLLRKDNLERILPFPRTIVAFQVRHHKKDRDVCGFREFVRMMEDEKLDKLTFLYIRNGAQVFRLETSIDFGERLFPDTDHPVLSAGEGKLYADLRKPKIISETEYETMVRADEEAHCEYERKRAEEDKKPRKERNHVFSPDYDSHRYVPFTRESVQYDDIGKHIREEMGRHNRVVLVLQGLLDRSPALHPHPPWRLFDGDGFTQALILHRDSDRTLVAGDKPDFEAYRARLNAEIAVGSITIGQEDAWLRFEARKENAKRDADHRWSRVEYRPDKFRPAGDPGPGRFARVARTDKHGHVHYRWEKERRGGDGPPVLRKYACKMPRILNVDAYELGDYKQFFADPRTREEYLEWAPLLLAAEGYKAGKHGKVSLLKEPPKPAPAPKPTGEAGHLKMLRSYLGKAVRLVRPIETTGGSKYKKGQLWRVTELSKGEFNITGILEDGSIELRKEDGYVRHTRTIRSVSHRDFALEPAVASDPKYEFKPSKRARSRIIDEGEE